MSVTRCVHCGRPIESVCSCAKAQQEAQYIPTPVPAASERMMLSTDRELYREPDTTGNGDFYSDSIHVTQAGGIGINVGGTVIVMPLQAWHRLALSPQPDRAKAEEDADLHKVIATAFYEGCKRIWPKRRLPYKASLLSVAYADEVAPAIIRTLTARAEAAEARAETARAAADYVPHSGIVHECIAEIDALRANIVRLEGDMETRNKQFATDREMAVRMHEKNERLEAALREALARRSVPREPTAEMIHQATIAAMSRQPIDQ